MTCQASPCGAGRRKVSSDFFPEAHSELFGGWQVNTNSIFGKGATARDCKWMSGSAPLAGTTAGRLNHFHNTLLNDHQERSSQKSAGGPPSPLDKDLSWMPHNGVLCLGCFRLLCPGIAPASSMSRTHSSRGEGQEERPKGRIASVSSLWQRPAGSLSIVILGSFVEFCVRSAVHSERETGVA